MAIPPFPKDKLLSCFMARDGRFLAWGQSPHLMLPVLSKAGKIGAASKHIVIISGVGNLDLSYLSELLNTRLKEKWHEDPGSDISETYSRCS